MLWAAPQLWDGGWGMNNGIYDFYIRDTIVRLLKVKYTKYEQNRSCNKILLSIQKCVEINLQTDPLTPVSRSNPRFFIWMEHTFFLLLRIAPKLVRANIIGILRPEFWRAIRFAIIPSFLVQFWTLDPRVLVQNSGSTKNSCPGLQTHAQML